MVVRKVVFCEEAANVTEVAAIFLVIAVCLLGPTQDSLFEVVVKRIFMTFADSQLYAIILPQILESLHAVQRHGILLSDLGIAADELHVLDILQIVVFDVVLLHSALDALECVQQVSKDGDLPLFAFSGWEAFGVYQAHLF